MELSGILLKWQSNYQLSHDGSPTVDDYEIILLRFLKLLADMEQLSFLRSSCSEGPVEAVW